MRTVDIEQLLSDVVVLLIRVFEFLELGPKGPDAMAVSNECIYIFEG